QRRQPSLWLAGMLRETGGVPFYLVACAQELQTPHDEAANTRVPWAIRQSVRERISAASPAVRAVLEALAVADGRASYQLLLALTAQSDADVLAAVECASRERLIEEDGQWFQFAY